MTKIRELEKTEFGMEGVIDCPFSKSEIGVMIGEGDFVEKSLIDYAEKCVEFFCNMPESLIEKLCEYTIRYCEESRLSWEEVGGKMPVPKGVKGKEIFQYISPTMLIIEEPTDWNMIGFHVEMECDWEEEHGLEWTVKDGKVRYVGPFDDMTAWDEKKLQYAGYYDEKKKYYNVNYVDREWNKPFKIRLCI